MCARASWQRTECSMRRSGVDRRSGLTPGTQVDAPMCALSTSSRCLQRSPWLANFEHHRGWQVLSSMPMSSILSCSGPSLAAFVLALLCAPAAQALQQVSLQLKWHHQFQFAGYYAALEQGYYREAGLEVRIIEGGPGVEV